MPVVFPSSPCFNRGFKYRLPDLILPQVSLPLCIKISSAVKKTKVTPSSTPSDLSVNVHDNNYLISIVFSSWCIDFLLACFSVRMFLNFKVVGDVSNSFSFYLISSFLHQ